LSRKCTKGWSETHIRTLLEVLGLVVGFEGVVLDGDDQVSSVVQAGAVKCSHEIDQSMRVSEKHVDCGQPRAKEHQNYVLLID